jgi:hypothetical protein
VFGRINSSTILETSLVRTWNSGHWLQLGGWQTSTDFSPGLITEVSDIYSAFAVAGWRDDRWSVYGGIQPYVVSGHVKLKLPSRVDSQGVLYYDDHRVDIRTPVIKFAGVQYRSDTSVRSWSISAVGDSLGRYMLKADYQRRF